MAEKIIAAINEIGAVKPPLVFDGFIAARVDAEFDGRADVDDFNFIHLIGDDRCGRAESHPIDPGAIESDAVAGTLGDEPYGAKYPSVRSSVLMFFT